MAAVMAVVTASPGSACVGAGCLRIWSTADGGGALTLQWDFAQKVQTFESFCAPGRTQCLYSTIDPGFMAPPDDVPDPGYFRLVDGTKVRAEIVMADPALSLNINGQKLYQPGDSALLGTMPTIHNHPSWQLVVPGDQFGDYEVSFRLTTDSAAYADSDVLTLVVTNVVPTPDASPTPTSTPTPSDCVGDCNDDGTVSVDELIRSVNIALGSSDPSVCVPVDMNGDGEVTINELVVAVTDALDGCAAQPLVAFDDIQQTIFTPHCATATCHDTHSATGNLVLVAGRSYEQLVGVPPDVLSARNAGLLRVDPGRPENSFLVSKLVGPPPGQGSRMPLVGDPLSSDEIELIRAWVLQGANP